MVLQQLDKQMGDMTEEKRQREAQIAEDKAEIERIDKEISTHINPGMVCKLHHCLFLSVELKNLS